MTQSADKARKVGIGSYVALAFAVVFFSPNLNIYTYNTHTHTDI